MNKAIKSKTDIFVKKTNVNKHHGKKRKIKKKIKR